VFDIWKDIDCGNDFDGSDTYIKQGAKLTDLVWPIADSSTGSALQPGTTSCIAIKWSVPSGTGNAIQSDSLSATITFEATQERHNPSFLCATPTAICGNGTKEGNEQCDDRNTISGDGCQADCTLPGICAAKPDVMQVLDRSGSIGTNMPLLKSAAHAFVAALDPKADGAHMGQTSFATAGTLDLNLTDNATTINAAINALVSSGTTNLAEGISLANAELTSSNDRLDATSPDYIIIITDGEPNVPDETTARTNAKTAADAADAANTKIYVVGVGVTSANADWLKNNIATDPTYYFNATNFSALQAILLGIATCQPQ
jgi:cysteine-rich repeat protein